MPDTMGQNEDIQKVESRVITIRNTQVLLDRDVAELYGVETRRINEAVKNNVEKFPLGYVIELTSNEKDELVENFDRFNMMKHSTALPHAFTEKGLYMLATILKSKTATDVTIAIIETFTKLRVLARSIQSVNDGVPNGVMPTKEDERRIQTMMTDVFKDPLPLKMRKMTFGVNLGFMKFSVETTREKE